MGYAHCADLASALADSKIPTNPNWEKRRPDAMTDADAKVAADRIRAEEAIKTGVLDARVEPKPESVGR